MKFYFSLLIIASLLIVACNKNVEHLESLESNKFIVDSFKVSQLSESIEIKNLKLFGSKVITLTPEANLIHIYKENAKKEYRLEKTIFLKNTNIPGSFFWHQNNWYVIDFDNNIFKYDSAWNFINRRECQLNLRQLKNNTLIPVYNNLPIKISGDTMVTHVFHKEFSGLKDYFKEQPYVKFKFTEDSVVLLEQLGSKPQSAIDYYLSMPFHCYRKDVIYTIYNCFDTIYTYNLSNKYANKYAINNPEYILPVKFPMDSIMNYSFITKYFNDNFFYTESIIYNPATDHFVIFYYAFPPNKKLKKTQLYAIVLDNNLKKINNIKFDKKYYDPQSAFYVEEKGIALGVYKNEFDFETTVFHIFNF